MGEQIQLSLSIIAAGALAGGVVSTAKDAAEFAFCCYDEIREMNKQRVIENRSKIQEN